MTESSKQKREMREAGIIISGAGAISAAGQGKDAFCNGLFSGENYFGIMQRPGRQLENVTAFIGAEIGSVEMPSYISKKMMRGLSFSEQAAIAVIDEAFHDARLDEVAPERRGLVVGGSNFHQRHTAELIRQYEGRLPFIPPSYGFGFLDSDIAGLCSELFGIRGLAYTAGGASASGQLAVIQAIQAVVSGQVDVCIAVGGLMDLSFWECQALRSLGAMGSDKFANRPDQACRPFDSAHDGFIYGEASAAVVIEKAGMRSVAPYGAVKGWALCMDGNRNPNPSYEGEVAVLKSALENAGLAAKDIDYINPHGTASVIGDEIELKAIRESGLGHAYINATKSIIGHGLSAAGTIELVACLIQMKEGRLHPTRNLESPLDAGYNWVSDRPIVHAIRNALNISIGFGGVNTALCLQRIQ